MLTRTESICHTIPNLYAVPRKSCRAFTQSLNCIALQEDSVKSAPSAQFEELLQPKRGNQKLEIYDDRSPDSIR